MVQVPRIRGMLWGAKWKCTATPWKGHRISYVRGLWELLLILPPLWVLLGRIFHEKPTEGSQVKLRQFPYRRS